jgi:hypothetical protein
MQLPPRVRAIIWAIALIFVGLLAWQLVFYFNHRGLVKVDIQAVPADSQLSIDGRSHESGVTYIKPGQHILLATRQYFDDDRKAIDTADFEKDQIIYMVPAANSEKARQYLQNNPEVQRARESAGGAEQERLRRVTLKRFPFLESLPRETLHYKIDYALGTEGKPKLLITLYPIINGPEDYPRYLDQAKQYKQEALTYLEQNGARPADFDISYTPSLP